MPDMPTIGNGGKFRITTKGVQHSGGYVEITGQTIRVIYPGERTTLRRPDKGELVVYPGKREGDGKPRGKLRGVDA